MPKIRQQSNTAERLKALRQSITVKPRITAERVEKLKKAGIPNRWKPGQSGNPGGKSRVVAEIAGISDRYSIPVLMRLIDTALHHDEPTHWIPAAREALNRMLGKPNLQVELTGEVVNHFVLRAPTPLESAELWEAKYGGAIDVTPSDVPKSVEAVEDNTIKDLG